MYSVRAAQISKCYTLNKDQNMLYFQNGINITDANFYAEITEKKLAEILKSDSDIPIPLLEERLAVLREAGKVLLEVREREREEWVSERERDRDRVREMGFGARFINICVLLII